MIGQLPSFPPFFSLFILQSLYIVNKLSNTYVFAFQKRQWFILGGESHLQSVRRKTHIYHLAVSRRGKNKLKGGVCSHPSFLPSVSSTFLMKYLSLTVRPVVTVQLFLPQLMVSCRSVQPLSLLAWLPAMPESFQQTLLSGSWSYMNKTAPNFKTMPCFQLYLYVSVKN